MNATGKEVSVWPSISSTQHNQVCRGLRVGRGIRGSGSAERNAEREASVNWLGSAPLVCVRTTNIRAAAHEQQDEAEDHRRRSRSPKVFFLKDIFLKPTAQRRGATWTVRAQRARARSVRPQPAGPGICCAFPWSQRLRHRITVWLHHRTMQRYNRRGEQQRCLVLLHHDQRMIFPCCRGQ